MDADWRKRIQITLIIFLVLAGVRVGIIFYERSHESEIQKPQPVLSSSYNITLDDYVTPHKLFPYDLKSAKEIVGKTVWVRAGNRVTYYPYSTATHSVNLSHSVGLLEPLEKLEAKDVILQNVNGQKQVMVAFAKSAAPQQYALSVGKVSGGSYDFFINEIFFMDDPHQLYNHWPPEVWNAIDHHQVKPGMSELQASFALGINMRVTGGDYGNRTVQYVTGDQTTMVTFSGNKAESIEPGPKP